MNIDCKLNNSPGAFTSQVYFNYHFQFTLGSREVGVSQHSQGPACNILPRCGSTSVHAWADGRDASGAPASSPHQLSAEPVKPRKTPFDYIQVWVISTGPE